MYFSSGPTAKPPGWKAENNCELLNLSHRSPQFKLAISDARRRLANALGLPQDYRLIFTPGGASGAFETALWNLLRDDVLALSWDKFSRLWAEDCRSLAKNFSLRSAPDGKVTALLNIPAEKDLVFVYLATPTGVVIPDEEWIPRGDGLIFADVTAAIFTHPIGWKNLDAAAFSWAKAVGGEGQHGCLVLSPKAQKRLAKRPHRAIPRLFAIPSSPADEPINTFSALALADLRQCLDFLEQTDPVKRTVENRALLDDWAADKDWLADLPAKPKLRANSPVAWRFCPDGPQNHRDKRLAKMLRLLTENGYGFDIASHPSIEAEQRGFRIWCGPTIPSRSLRRLTEGMDWAYKNSRK